MFTDRTAKLTILYMTGELNPTYSQNVEFPCKAFIGTIFKFIGATDTRTFGRTERR